MPEGVAKLSALNSGTPFRKVLQSRQKTIHSSILRPVMVCAYASVGSLICVPEIASGSNVRLSGLRTLECSMRPRKDVCVRKRE